jgi:putative flippase GtrA
MHRTFHRLRSTPSNVEGRRFAAFAGVGAMGFIVQLTVLMLLTLLGVSPLAATCLAVEAAVLHNFAWHERWTWSDRRYAPHGAGGRLVKFNLTNGLTSILGSAGLVVILVHGFGLNVILANILTVIALSFANFLIADSWVFAAAAMAAVSVLGTPASAAAQPSADTLAAWDRVVSSTEARLQRDVHRPRGSAAAGITGNATPIDGGLVNHWTGALFIKGVTLDAVLDRLTNPGTPPPQEDVVESRVLGRYGKESLHVYLKLVRRTIVTATYDTEHDVNITRLSPTLAVSRSVSTSIAEVGGGDRGFLWRLNSYWRYQQLTGGVLVQMESLTLSRSVPAIVRPVALPIVNRVARESVVRTLSAFRSWFPPSRDALRRGRPYGLPKALTLTPAASSAMRSDIASAAEPGVSP